MKLKYLMTEKDKSTFNSSSRVKYQLCGVVYTTQLDETTLQIRTQITLEMDQCELGFV
jgi:hypothetical protein